MHAPLHACPSDAAAMGSLGKPLEKSSDDAPPNSSFRLPSMASAVSMTSMVSIASMVSTVGCEKGKCNERWHAWQMSQLLGTLLADVGSVECERVKHCAR